jgi:hypothetical protein
VDLSCFESFIVRCRNIKDCLMAEDMYSEFLKVSQTLSKLGKLGGFSIEASTQEMVAEQRQRNENRFAWVSAYRERIYVFEYIFMHA